MARPVADGLRVLRRRLAPTPQRREFALRQALVCALVTWIVQAHETPDPALTAYLVFFMNATDRASSVLRNLVLLAVMTVIVALVLGMAGPLVDHPLLRFLGIGAFSCAALYLASASRLQPLAPILALGVAYGLDQLGAAPAGEAATRGLLYVWLFAAIPVGVSLVVNLCLAPAPRRLVEAALAERLRACARQLQAPQSADRDFAALLQQTPGELSGWLGGLAREHTATPEALAALQRSVASVTALLLLVDRMRRRPALQLPAAVAAPLAAMMTAMADAFADGAIAFDVRLPEPEPDAGLDAAQAQQYRRLCDVLAGFAERPTGEAALPEAVGAAARAGFWRADAGRDPRHLDYALKTTTAALICLLIYEGLDWPGIHTCFITCYVVALPTAAETVEKLMLRIVGCLLGALAGTTALVWLLPLTTSIGALMLLVFAGAWAGARVAACGPEISYAGFQIAFAFFLCVMQGAQPAFELDVARDRVIGVLLGTGVSGLVAIGWRPVGVAGRVDAGIDALLARLAALAGATTDTARHGLALQALAAVHALDRDLALAAREPLRIRPAARWQAQRRRCVRRAQALLAPLLLAGEREAGRSADAEARLGALAGRRPGEPAAGAGPEGAGVAAPDGLERALRALERSLADRGDGAAAHARA